MFWFYQASDTLWSADGRSVVGGTDCSVFIELSLNSPETIKNRIQRDMLTYSKNSGKENVNFGVIT